MTPEQEDELREFLKTNLRIDENEGEITLSILNSKGEKEPIDHLCLPYNGSSDYP